MPARSEELYFSELDWAAGKIISVWPVLENMKVKRGVVAAERRDDRPTVNSFACDLNLHDDRAASTHTFH